MKFLNILLIVFLWNTTYRCKKDELTIDCNEAAKNMIGTWTGFQSNNAKTFSDSFTLKVSSSDGCTFFGESSYSQSITTFSLGQIIPQTLSIIKVPIVAPKIISKVILAVM